MHAALRLCILEAEALRVTVKLCMHAAFRGLETLHRRGLETLHRRGRAREPLAHLMVHAVQVNFDAANAREAPQEGAL
jgi:hypothetical protein